MATLDKTSSYDEIEHDLILCQGCGSVITTRRHMEEIRKKIEKVGLLDKDRNNIESYCISCKKDQFVKEATQSL